mmetsp:Transcript_109515/g.315391  ORF Transcript_109515/g.315391 Transcript_109515/m.315391 type:complete len:104 (-) Transcript_109515:1480-1791(-)
MSKVPFNIVAQLKTLAIETDQHSSAATLSFSCLQLGDDSSILQSATSVYRSYNDRVERGYWVDSDSATLGHGKHESSHVASSCCEHSPLFHNVNIGLFAMGFQ